jgi:O-antigen/teichoic acid export membrane protein
MIQRLRDSDFVRHNTIYLIAAVAVGALNYLYYPVLGRLMDPAAFGEVQTVVSLFLQALAYLMVMGLVTVHIVANRTDQREANHTISELERFATLISVGLLGVVVLFSESLKDYLQFESILPFILLGIAVTISVPYMIRSAYVNGKKLFALNAWSSITAAAGKLVFSAVLVAVGFGVGGAIFGIILAQVAALVLAAHFAKQHGFRDERKGTVLRWPDMRRIKPELPYAGLVLVGSLSITILYSVDVIVVKHFFDPHVAGLYASVATVARIIFFLTVPITQVMMPSIRLDAKPVENYRAARKSLLLLTAVGSVMLVLFWLAPSFIVTTLMGNDYQQFASLLPKLGLAIYIICVLNLIVTYYMALRVYAVGALAALGAVGTYFAMNANHSSLDAVVNALLISVTVLGVIFAIWIGLSGRASIKASTKRAKRGGEAWQHNNSYQS